MNIYLYRKIIILLVPLSISSEILGMHPKDKPTRLQTFDEMIQEAQNQSPQAKKRLYFSRLPRELRLESLKFLIGGITNPEEASHQIKKILATQELDLSKEDLKAILKLLWQRINLNPLDALIYSDKKGIDALKQITSLKQKMEEIERENNFIEDANNPAEILQKYVAEGIDINAKNSKGETALDKAYNRIDTIGFLLRNGASPNVVNDYNEGILTKALYFSAGCIDKQIVSLFLQFGADPNLKSKHTHYSTPLFRAALDLARPDIVKLLLDAGADPFIQNVHGKTVIDFIRESFIHVNNDHSLMKKEFQQIMNLFKKYLPEELEKK